MTTTQKDRLQMALGVLTWRAETVQDVGAKLKSYGAKGTPRNGTSCPVANYLKTYWFPEAASVAVDGRWVVVRTRDQRLEAPLPDLLMNFIRCFDRGEVYPSLATRPLHPKSKWMWAYDPWSYNPKAHW